MAFTWTKEKIDFFKEASIYTGFHREVGEIIRPYLNKSWSLCDLGCGLGFLDLVVAPYVKDITAIDLSQIAIDDYRKRLAETDVTNISIEMGDLDKPIERTWDVLLLSFFGKPGKELDRIFVMAKKEAVLITYEQPLSDKHGKLKKSDNRPTTAEHEAYLIDRGYDYELIRREMDFGQPFRDLESAEAYFKSYSRESDPTKQNELIRKNLDNVDPTGDPEFPYFLSKKKGIGIFIVKI